MCGWDGKQEKIIGRVHGPVSMVCDYINNGGHIKEICLLKAWGVATLKNHWAGKGSIGKIPW